MACFTFSTDHYEGELEGFDAILTPSGATWTLYVNSGSYEYTGPFPLIFSAVVLGVVGQVQINVCDCGTDTPSLMTSSTFYTDEAFEPGGTGSDLGDLSPLLDVSSAFSDDEEFTSSSDAPDAPMFPRSFVYDSNAPAFTDETSNWRNSINAPAMPATPHDGDILYFGLGFRTDNITVNITTAGSFTGTFLWQYWNGSSWANFTVITDPTNNLKNAGLQKIIFVFPIGLMQRTTVNNFNMFFIRALLGGLGTVITIPVIQQAYTTYPRSSGTSTPTLATTSNFSADEDFTAGHLGFTVSMVADLAIEGIFGAEVHSAGGGGSSMGPNYPGTGTAGGPGTTWANATRITAADSSFSNCTLAAGANSKALQGQSWDFSTFPTGVTVDGLVFEIGRYSDNATITELNVVINIGANVSTDKHGTSIAWSSTTTDVATYGGATDLWGMTLTDTDIRTGAITTLLKVTNSGGSSDTAHCDFQRMTVYYH